MSETDPATGILKPVIADAVFVDTVILTGSGKYKNGEEFKDVVYRVPKRLWLTDMKGTVEGFVAWMRKHNPLYTDDFNVVKVRDEATDSNKVTERPVV